MFGLAVGYTAYSSQKEEISLSDIALDNVEALANNGEWIYNGETKWERFHREDGTGYNCSQTGSETC